MKCTAIVLAAGQGKRMGSSVPKQFLELDGKPILYYSLKCFEDSERISDIILVTGKESVEFCESEVRKKYGFSKIRKITAGGKERYDSVYEGLKAAGDCDYVFIHDGARPFVDEGILERTLEAARQYGACTAAVPSKDTMKLATADGLVEKTLDRSVLWNVQTPQVFRYQMICDAHKEMRLRDLTGVTDDAMIVELLGCSPVKLVMGSYENIKITTPEDLPVAESIRKKRGCQEQVWKN